MRLDSGQLASAAPRAPTPTGRPDQVFVPVMLAAMMLPTAGTMEGPVPPQTCAANGVAIGVARIDAKRGGAAGVFIGAVSVGSGPGPVNDQWTRKRGGQSAAA